MLSGSNSEKLRRIVGGGNRLNYSKYDDVFMTSSQSRQRRPINRSHSVNGVREEPMFQKRNITRELRAERFPNDNLFELGERDKTIATQRDCEFDDQFVNIDNSNNSIGKNTVSDFYMDRNEFFNTQGGGLDRSQVALRQFNDGLNSNYDAPHQSGIYFKKRQLPQLQRYRSGIPTDQESKNYSDYFDEYLLPKKKSKYSLSFPLLWQKFVITFTSLLSIICLTWITYNWKTTNGDNSIPEIKGEKTFFKVLPDAPNIVSSAYNNKTVYERVDPNIQTKRYNERLMTSTEEPGELPISDNFDNSNFDGRSPIQNYTIIDDRDYYVKCKKNNDVLMTRQQVATIRKKLSSYSNSAVLSNVSCSIRKVANTQGQLGEYILIGPFCNEVTARNVGKFCQINNGEIISVQKK